MYVHCTAGLGRAPAVCIAYLFWWCGMDLDEAYAYLTNIRPCGPKVWRSPNLSYGVRPCEWHQINSIPILRRLQVGVGRGAPLLPSQQYVERRSRAPVAAYYQEWQL